MNETEIMYEDESYKIIGACFEAYNEIGSGFLEAVFQECLEIEFEERGIPFVARQKMQLRYKNRPLKSVYIPDFVCYGKIIVELKELFELTGEHRAQVHNNLKGTGHPLGLLVNFGKYPKLQSERIVR